MAYTSGELVAGIIKLSSGDTVDAVAPFIDTAGSLVTRLCVNSGYSEETLELIERWLSAHFYAIFRPRAKQEAVTGGAGVSKTNEDIKVDLNLSLTKWGQTAMVLDTAGSLAAWNNRSKTVQSNKVTFSWLGSPHPCWE